MIARHPNAPQKRRTWDAIWRDFIGSVTDLATAAELSRQGVYDLRDGKHARVPVAVLRRVLGAWGTLQDCYCGEVPTLDEIVDAWRRAFEKRGRSR